MLRTPPRFNFWRTIYSHGWCTLPPFHVDEEDEVVRLVLRLLNGNVVECTLRDGKTIKASLSPKRPLSSRSLTEIRAQLATCLRLEEDFSEFYAQAQRLPEFRWIPRSGAGRLLRAPTVFEDIVKTICTTNCTWALTEVMVSNLVNELGTPLTAAKKAFPTPSQMAGVTERFMRKTIRSGYRSPYLLELAERVASGSLDVESWRTSPLPTERLHKEVRSIKGMGEYAAGNLMRLLGRYESLALDSWVRSKYSELYRGGRRVSDATIERAYARYGPWKGLFFWLDMTKEWLTEKFPF